jgi:predicted GNAT family N-acyltransferase
MIEDDVVRRISTELTYDLRGKVLRPGRPEEDCQFSGDDHEATVHFGAYAGDRIVAIASLYRRNQAGLTTEDAWQLRGMATDEAVRGEGYGKLLVARCLHHAIDRDAVTVWCNARASARGFYEGLGFNLVGEKFEIPGVGHHFLMEIDPVRFAD